MDLATTRISFNVVDFLTNVLSSLAQRNLKALSKAVCSRQARRANPP